MKGIMKVAVAAVAVALCGAAKASSDLMDTLYWNFTNVEASPSSATPTVGSYSAYIFDWAKYDDVFSLISSKNVTQTSLSSLSFDSSANTKTDSSYLSSWTVQRDNSMDAATLPSTAFALIFDADFSNYMVVKKDGAAMLNKTEVPAKKQDPTTSAYQYFKIDVYNWGSQANNTWVAIPEPTSGFLLLVGLSALALKRKRAA